MYEVTGKEMYDRIEKRALLMNYKDITELCRDSGASRGALSDLKYGRSESLSMKTMTKLAKALKVSVSFFTTPEGNTDAVINDISQYQAILAWVLDNEDVPDEVKYVIRKELPKDPMGALSALSYQAGARFDCDTKKLPTLVFEDGLDKEAREVADAYMDADRYVRFGVRKLLGLEVQNEDIQLAARKSDKPHPVTGPDTDVDI